MRGRDFGSILIADYICSRIIDIFVRSFRFANCAMKFFRNPTISREANTLFQCNRQSRRSQVVVQNLILSSRRIVFVIYVWFLVWHTRWSEYPKKTFTKPTKYAILTKIIHFQRRLT